ncbi:CHAP domain-containing protein [Rathayibacter sp. VKM Ac-2760]|uniref:CHAP domain-containing protein n=1 Tax=Rathayibacter sp. VKM Ac-2760 TaxID=2609253 RepID=UPI0013162A2B|nr:CHAP domain-containing protein [Rathayibacter sp. VKM Ac-2760]QHC58138.1 CHAP domain-containing protein [Rathayibacter sp. VKM Ac-2760]
MTDEQVDETAGATRDGSASGEVHPTRRSRRVAESAAQAPRVAPRTRPVPTAPVAVKTPVLATVPPVRRRPGRALRATVSTVAVAAIAGMVAVMALPAYSFDPAPDSQAAIEAAARIQALGNQKLTVASTAVQEQVIRDSFTAPTQEQLDEAAAQARALAAAAEKAAADAAAAAAAAAEEAANTAAGTSSGSTAASRSAGSSTSVTPREEGDDYPWRDALTDDQGGGLSPLRYYYRECVDFVAWRLNRDQGSTGAPFKWTWGNLTPGGGSAYAWAGQWASHGWETSSTPVPGSVAWFNGNHVAYVQSVNADGTVSLEEYNWGNDHAYHTRTVAASSVPLFLYPPS